jgi:hypothetical protein
MDYHAAANLMATGYLGSFAASIAGAYFRADSTNCATLTKAFADLFNRADALAKEQA